MKTSHAVKKTGPFRPRPKLPEDFEERQLFLLDPDDEEPKMEETNQLNPGRPGALREIWEPNGVAFSQSRSRRNGARPMVAGDGGHVLGDWWEANGVVASGKTRFSPRRTTYYGRGTGYHADVPDHSDYSKSKLPEHIRKRLNGKLPHFLGKAKPTDHINIGDGNLWLWPVEDQGPLQSCTANAVIGMVEYLLRREQSEQKKAAEEINLSRMFLYKATRYLLGWEGDTGAFLRTTIRAMATFGVPPELHWPYIPSQLDVEPTTLTGEFAGLFKALAYVRLDENGSNADATLDRIRRVLSDKFPVVFGFPVYRSIGLMGSDYVIPPADAYERDTRIGGHAVLAVGYDDRVPFKYPGKNGKTITGAFIIRNSWGRQWGDQGFAYLPYAYLEGGLACDFWTIFSQASFPEAPFQ